MKKLKSLQSRNNKENVMKRRFVNLIVVFITLLTQVTAGVTPAYAATSAWQQVGAAGFSAGTANYTSLAFDNGTPYVA
jgi:predicted dienelactone hydrolase